jgi:hypothetical protein
VLGPAAAERMRQGAAATTAFAAVLLGVAAFRYSFGRRGSRSAAALLLASMAFSVLVPLWMRGPGDAPVPTPHLTVALPVSSDHPPRVRLLLLDGASLGFIRLRVAAGQLPNFGRLLDRGAAMDLSTLRPTQAEPVWAAAATGKYPPKTGVRSNAVYRVRPDDADPVDLLPDYCFAYALQKQGFLRADPLTAASLHARPIWDILKSGIVDWPLTFPVRPYLGYVISERFDEGSSSPLRLADASAAYPTTAVDIAREAFDAWQSRPWYEVLPSFGVNDPVPAGSIRARWDRAFSESADQLEREFSTNLTAVRFEGLDTFGHNYLHDAQPELFGDASDQPRRSVLDKYYASVDAEVGRIAGSLERGDLLLVISGFGMERESLVKRLVAAEFGWLLGWSDRSGSHEHAPDGFLLAYGTNVATGQVARGAIVDLAPTVLYYMGLSVGHDMDGFARTDLFAGTYTKDHSVAYVATYEK